MLKTRNWGDALPGRPVQFLSLDETLAIHERLIEVFGGAPGVRDEGLLQSALYRPQTGYYEQLEEMAAALFESLLTNHAFVDGNKRIAFFGTDVFLRMNGWKLEVTADEGERFIIGILETGTHSFDQVLPWIRDHIVRI